MCFGDSRYHFLYGVTLGIVKYNNICIAYILMTLKRLFY